MITPRRRVRGLDMPSPQVMAMAADGDAGAAALIRAFMADVQPIVASAKSHGADITAIQKDLDALNIKMAGILANGVGNGTNAAPDPNTPHVVDFIRGKVGAEADLSKHIRAKMAAIGQDNAAALLGLNAAMQVGSNPDGGFTVLPEMERTIQTVQQDISPLRNLCTVVKTGSAEYKRILSVGGTSAGWAGERDPRVESSTSKLVELTFQACEVYAMPKATQSILDDSFMDVAGWLADEVAMEMSAIEGTAFVSGSGVKEPMGFLQIPTETGVDFARSDWDTIQHIACGSSTPTDAQLVDALVTTSMTLRAPYRKDAVWLMNRATATRVRKLRDSAGLLIWSNDYGRIAEGTPSTLLGYEVELDENMPSIAANAYPIALANWKRAYLIVDRVGIRVLRDPYMAKPYVLFYTTKRVGGGPLDRNAIKLVKVV